MERETLMQMWDESWAGGIWFGPWSKALEGLTARQAAWQPQPGRHSIGQLVAHVAFWREVTIDLLEGRPEPAADVVARSNFPAFDGGDEAVWTATRARLESTHRRLRAAIADPKQSIERVRYHLVHDSNHLGQILYLRGLQGMDPIEG